MLNGPEWGDAGVPRRDERTDDRGFTFIEVVIALVILTVAVLGIGASTASMLGMAATAEVRTRAVAAAEDRVQEVQMEPRYDQIEILYDGAEDDLDALEGFTRVTSVDQVLDSLEGGTVLDYKVVTVTVTGPTLPDPVERSVVLGGGS